METEETRKAIEETEAQLEIAIKTKDVEEWCLFRAMRYRHSSSLI